MATKHFRNAKVLVHGHELSGDFQSIEIAHSAEMLDETTFGDSTRVYKGGLTVTDVSGSGLWNPSVGQVEDLMFGIIGSDDKVIALFPDGITEGTVTEMGYAMKGVVCEYNIGGPVGALLPFNFKVYGRGIL